MKDTSLHMLFVDDNQGDLDLVREALEENDFGLQLHTACDGEAALDFLHRRDSFHDAPRPNLILLDLNMPRKSGMETLREIKSDDELNLIPVIIFSSSTALSDMRRAYALHANAYVIKPPGLDDFLQIVQQLGTFWCTVATIIH